MMSFFKQKYVYVILTALGTLIISDKLIENEFRLLAISEFTFILGVIVIMVLMILSVIICKTWIWKTTLLSLLTLTTVFFLAPKIAERMNSINQSKVNSKDKNLILFYGIIPSFVDVEGADTVEIHGLKGARYIYNYKTEKWTVDG